MTFFTLLGMWIVWLIIAALLLRWIVGGTIDCLKHGRKAGITSWMGFALAVIILYILAVL